MFDFIKMACILYIIMLSVINGTNQNFLNNDQLSSETVSPLFNGSFLKQQPGNRNSSYLYFTKQNNPVYPMKVDLTKVPFEILHDHIKQAVSSVGMVALNLSNRHMHDETLEILMESLGYFMENRSLENIVEIDLSYNELTVEGLQSMLTILSAQSFRILNVAGNRIEGEDLFKYLGTDLADDEYSDTHHRLKLDTETRKEILEKIIWMPQSYFDPNNSNNNPTGIYVTPDVIFRHRFYYGIKTNLKK